MMRLFELLTIFKKHYLKTKIYSKYIYMSISDKSNVIDMDKKSLKKLSKSELIRLLLKQENKRKIIVVDDTKPVPAPRKSVKQMIEDYEEQPRYYKPRPPVPTPRKSVKQMVKDYEEKRKPVPTPRTKIEQTDKALEGYTKSYKISIKNNKDPLAQMQKTPGKLPNFIWITYDHQWRVSNS